METDSHPAIAVHPVSPQLFDHEDFAALVLELVRETGLMADQVEIRLGYLYGDAWPPEWTWVTVALDRAGSEAITAVVAALIAWGRNWLAKARRTNADAAPIKITIYGPDGERLRDVEVLPEDG